MNINTLTDIITATESAQARADSLVYPAVVYAPADLGRPELPAILASDGYYKIYIESAEEMREELMRTTQEELRPEPSNASPEPVDADHTLKKGQKPVKSVLKTDNGVRQSTMFATSEVGAYG